jgi:hypothetical protein|tara:strand:+ start:615 stop:716 length:102 start_codon:yes stop_codon:yes gene_type:complete
MKKILYNIEVEMKNKPMKYFLILFGLVVIAIIF